MNERIKELARLAGGRSTYGTLRGPIVPPPPGWFDHTTVDLEKFAELIVEECMNATRGASTGVDAFNGIKNHFGVK